MTTAEQLAAAHAIACTFGDDVLDAGHIVPSVCDERLVRLWLTRQPQKQATSADRLVLCFGMV